MDDHVNAKKGKRRGLWWKVPIGLLVLLVAALTVVLLNIDAIARSQINKALNRYLVAGGDVASVQVRLFEGKVVLEGLRLHPPPGYGEQVPLSWRGLTVDLAPLSLLTGKIVVEQIRLEKAALAVVRSREGKLNVLELAPATTPGPTPAEEQGRAAPPEVPAVQVNALVVKDLSLKLFDRMAGDQWSAGLRFDMTVDGFTLQDVMAQEILLDGLDAVVKDLRVDPLPGFSAAPLLSLDRLHVAARGLDPGASRVAVSDVSLDGLWISVERNAEREINLVKLKEAWLPAADADPAADKDQQGRPEAIAASTANAAPAWDLPAVAVDKIALTSISLQLLDSIEGNTWRAGVDGLDIRMTGVEVEDLVEQALVVASFDLDVEGVAVDQVPGFGPEKMFSLARFTVTSEKGVRPGEAVVVEQVRLEGLTSSVTMRADGLSNLKALSQAWLHKAGGARPPEEESEAEAETPAPALAVQPVLLKKIVLEGGPLTYRDEMIAAEPIVARLGDVQLTVNDLRLFSDATAAGPAAVSLAFELAQPSNLPTAYLGTLARIGPLGAGIPMVNAQARLVGLKLDTLGSLVPPATRTALGATGLDAAISLVMDADGIDLNAEALTDRGIDYNGLRIHGAPGALSIEPGPVFAGVFNRVSDGLINMGKSGLKSSVDIVEGGAHAVEELGVGTLKLGANLGKSLFETTVGVVTIDKEKVAAGVVGTTKGTVDLTMDSVKGSGQAAGGGLKSSAADLKGESRVRAWDADIPARYRETMRHAERVLAEMPYPPVAR